MMIAPPVERGEQTASAGCRIPPAVNVPKKAHGTQIGALPEVFPEWLQNRASEFATLMR